MRSAPVAWFAGLLLFLGLGVALADDGAIDKLIKQLDDPDLATRKEAVAAGEGGRADGCS